MQPTSVIELSLEELDTPSLIVDRPALLRNIARLMDSVKGTGVRVRAHAKSTSITKDQPLTARTTRR